MNIQNPWEIDISILRNTTPSLRYSPGSDFAAWQKEARQKLAELMGLPLMKRCDPQYQTCYEKEYDDFTETRFTFYSEEGYAVPCHMLLPKNRKAPCKVVVCLQGHSTGMHISLGRTKYPRDEQLISGGDRDFAVRAVKEGCAAITLEQRHMGECGGSEKGPSCVHSSVALTALLFGRTTIGERVWDVMRLIDLIETKFDFLDKNNIILLGNSGGGTTTFYTACIDDRIACAVPSCSVCTYKDSIGSYDHCPCNFIPSIARYFDMGDLAGLIAPRKLVIVNGKEDPSFPAHGVMETYELAQGLFRAAGYPEHLALVTGSEGHRFYADQTWEVIHRMMDDAD